MATLEKIRSRAGLLVGVVGLALFAFIIGDFLNSGSSFIRQSQETVGSVNGEKIKIYDYEDKVNERIKMQYGENHTTEDINFQVRQSVWETIVEEAILDEQTGELGMVVTPQEMYEMVNGKEVHPMVRQIPLFFDRQTGAFNRESMLSFFQMIQTEDLSQYGAEGANQIAQMKEYWLYCESELKRIRLAEKYNTLFAKAMGVNNLEAQYSLSDRGANTDIEYAVEKYLSIPDSTVTVSDSEIKSLYNKRKERYKTAPFRNIQYLAVDIRPSEEDYKEVEERINKLKPEFETSEEYAALVAENSDVPYMDANVALTSLNDTIQQFVANNTVGAVEGPTFAADKYTMMKLIGTVTAPDSLKLRHIFVQRQDEAATKALADSLLTVLKANADFDTICAKFSMAQTKEKGGDLGWLTETVAVASLGKEFKDLCYAAKVNDYFLFSAGNGTHIFQITEETAPVAKANVAIISMTVSPSSKTYSKIYNEVNQILSTSKTVEDLDNAAKEKGYAMLTSDMLTNETQTVGTLKDSRRIVKWAFESKLGDISEIYDCSTQFAVACVTEVNDEGYIPLKNVAAPLKMELIAEKKAQMMMQKIKESDLASISAAATAMNTKVDTAKFIAFNTRQVTNVGYEPALVGQVTTAELNKVTGPVQGRNGIYVFKAYNRTDGPAGDIQKEKTAMQMTLQSRANYQLIPALKKKMDIEDYRIRFF